VFRALRALLVALFALSVSVGSAASIGVRQVNPYAVYMASTLYLGLSSNHKFEPYEGLAGINNFSFEFDGLVVNVDPKIFNTKLSSAFGQYVVANRKVCTFYEESFTTCAGELPTPGPDGLLWISNSMFASSKFGCYFGDYYQNYVVINNNSGCNVFYVVPPVPFDFIRKGMWDVNFGTSGFFYDPTYNPKNYSVEQWHKDIGKIYLKALLHYGDGKGNGDSPVTATQLQDELGFSFSERVEGNWIDADHPAQPLPGDGGTTPGTGDTGGTGGTGGTGTNTTGYEDGTGTACGGLKDLSVFQKAVAGLFQPCEDWGKKFGDMRVSLMTKAPLGYSTWNPVDSNLNYSGACEALHFGGGGDIEGVPIPDIRVCGTLVGDKMHEFLRPVILMLIVVTLLNTIIKWGKA